MCLKEGKIVEDWEICCIVAFVKGVWCRSYGRSYRGIKFPYYAWKFCGKNVVDGVVGCTEIQLSH